MEENEIGAFLERNGFKKISKHQWQNDVVIGISDKCFVITHGFGETVFSKEFSLYWLIGYLTYNGFLNKEYVQ
jgi:hypothetical protein